MKNKGFSKLDVELPPSIGSINILFETLISFLMTETEVKILTYDAAIQYFINEQPDVKNVVKGAILRQPCECGYSIVQVFLNDKNQLVCMSSGRPYGRRLVVQKLDQDLAEAFDNEDLVIVE